MPTPRGSSDNVYAVTCDGHVTHTPGRPPADPSRPNSARRDEGRLNSGRGNVVVVEEVRSDGVGSCVRRLDSDAHHVKGNFSVVVHESLLSLGPTETTALTVTSAVSTVFRREGE